MSSIPPPGYVVGSAESKTRAPVQYDPDLLHVVSSRPLQIGQPPMASTAAPAPVNSAEQTIPPAPPNLPAKDNGQPAPMSPDQLLEQLFVPRMQVTFEIPIGNGHTMGVVGLYHRVYVSQTLVVLVFDKRCRVTAPFYPPKLAETIDLTIHSPAGSRRVKVLSAGLSFECAENSLGYTVLVTDNKPEPPAPAPVCAEIEHMDLVDTWGQEMEPSAEQNFLIGENT